MGTIVAGIDGSKGSIEALRFACGEAHLRGSRVRAVWAWHVPPLAYEDVFTTTTLSRQAFADDANAGLQETLERAGDLGVEVEAVVREGSAVSVLVAEAEKAELLVVGSRGHGGFRGLLLGSVSQGCAQHARCPTIIVPSGTAQDGAFVASGQAMPAADPPEGSAFA
jgi:nucleotide-binding universal stress UspA family protein